MLGIHYRPCPLVKQGDDAVDGVHSFVSVDQNMTIIYLSFLTVSR